jgi:hypothetical protein
VDLDDYLDRWADDLDAILRSARPPSAFAEYEAATASVRNAGPTAHQATAGERDRSVATPDTTRHGHDSRPKRGNSSALWQLDITDVGPIGPDYRGPNPLGHVGDSENYFVVHVGPDGGFVATDHKRTATFTAVTYLLVDMGERPVTNPNGPLSDREVWLAWRHAKQHDFIPEDDPVPRRALCHVAREENLLDSGDEPDGKSGWLPDTVYRQALAAVRERGVDPGRQTGGEMVAPIPTETIGELLRRPGWEAVERAARQRGLRPPSQAEVRERTRDAICQGMADAAVVGIRAPRPFSPPGSGWPAGRTIS